jgi:NAD(P)-dependent dehydrogenase (short-subunit alcohol dehydrogenase family)
MRFRGQVAAVTGGGSGIGLGIARRFTREGARVVVLDVNVDAAEAAASEMGGTYGQAMALHLDVSDKASVDAAVERILETWGQIDVWVNSAGVFCAGCIADTPDLDEWERIVAVNLTGMFLCCQAVARPMIAQGSGNIINISSIAGKIGFPEEAGYCGTKAGAIGLTRSVAVELAAHGIRANAICPGNIRTPMLEAVDESICLSEGWERGTFLKQTAERIPLGYIGDPEDVAAVAAFLASDDASFIVGQAINPDGGLVLS